jgi:hypothetical protein
MRRPLVQTAAGQDDDAGLDRTSERTTIFAGARLRATMKRHLTQQLHVKNQRLCFLTLQGLNEAAFAAVEGRSHRLPPI